MSLQKPDESKVSMSQRFKLKSPKCESQAASAALVILSTSAIRVLPLVRIAVFAAALAGPVAIGQETVGPRLDASDSQTAPPVPHLPESGYEQLPAPAPVTMPPNPGAIVEPAPGVVVPPSPMPMAPSG